jgi:hypothetical protein
MGVIVISSRNTRLAQWSLTSVLEAADWLVVVVEVVVGDPGASGAEGGISENVPDEGERGD